MASLINQNANSSAGAATLAVTLPTVTAGKPVIVAFKYEGLTTTLSVSDGTNTLTPLTEIRHANNDLAVRLFYILSPPGSGGTVTYTITLGASRNFIGLQVFQCTGTGSASVDIEGGSTGNGALASTGNLNSSGTEVWALAFHGNYTGSTSNTGLWGVAAADGEQADGVQDYAWYKGLTSPGTIAGTAVAATGDWAVGALLVKFGTAAVVIPGEMILSHFTEENDLGVLRVQNFFKAQAGMFPLGHKSYNVPSLFQADPSDLGLLKVQSQFKGLAGVQPGPVAGYRNYNRLSLYQADPVDLGVERVQSIFSPRRGILAASQKTYLKPLTIESYAETFDFFGNAVVLGAASPGGDPAPIAIIGRTIYNAYLEALDFGWGNTSYISKPRGGVIPPPVKLIYNHIFTNPYYEDVAFEFANAYRQTGNKIGIPGAVPRRVVQALAEIARQLQEEINQFPSMFAGFRNHPFIGTIPPPPPVSTLLPGGFIGVGINREGGG